MKRLLTILAAGLLTVGLSGGVGAPEAIARGGASPVAGSVTGTGQIIGETLLAGGNATVFSLTEVQNFNGSIVGTRVQAVPESVAFNLLTLKGEYFAVFNFTGTINGQVCDAVMTEKGRADLNAGTFGGRWKILYSDCGLKGGGSFKATATFTTPTDYNFTATYFGIVR